MGNDSIFYPNFFRGKPPPNKIGLFLIRRHSLNIKTGGKFGEGRIVRRGSNWEKSSRPRVDRPKESRDLYMISDLLADIGVGIFVCILLIVLGLQIHGAVRNVKVSYSKKHD